MNGCNSLDETEGDKEKLLEAHPTIQILFATPHFLSTYPRYTAST